MAKLDIRPGDEVWDRKEAKRHTVLGLAAGGFFVVGCDALDVHGAYLFRVPGIGEFVDTPFGAGRVVSSQEGLTADSPRVSVRVRTDVDHEEEFSVFIENLTRPTISAPPTPPPPPEDRKTYGVKAPLGLIPWRVVPMEYRPKIVDGERIGESFVELAIRRLLDLDPALLEDAARAFAHGAAKYGHETWRKATSREEYAHAFYRHMYADACGEDQDPDSGLLHKAHALASALIYAELGVLGVR